MRQCPDRYTIRAGRNLPDKEFRYLRTVIVTAAVYWGFGSKLLRHSANAVKSLFHVLRHTLPEGPAYNPCTCLPLRSQVHTHNTWLQLLTTSAECRITSPLNLPAPGRCQTLYVGFTPSAESCVFTKQSPGPGFCDRKRLRMNILHRRGTPSP